MNASIYKVEKQQGPTYSTGDYIQYLVITYNGKESEKEWRSFSVYIYIHIYICIYIYM